MPIDPAFYKPTLIKRVQDSAIEYALNKMDHIILQDLHFFDGLVTDFLPFTWRTPCFSQTGPKQTQ